MDPTVRTVRSQTAPRDRDPVIRGAALSRDAPRAPASIQASDDGINAAGELGNPLLTIDGGTIYVDQKEYRSQHFRILREKD